MEYVLVNAVLTLSDYDLKGLYFKDRVGMENEDFFKDGVQKKVCLDYYYHMGAYSRIIKCRANC